MRYSKAEILFADEPIWKAVHEGERKEIFADALVSVSFHLQGIILSWILSAYT